METTRMQLAILEAGEKLLREKGYHGWSYQNISDQVGIRKASIHYHFPRKQDLGNALIKHYAEKIRDALNHAAQLSTKKEKLLAFVELYASVVEDQHSYCLCGMLAADFMTLPAEMQHELKKAFKEQEEWLEAFVEVKDAKMILSSMQGLLLLSRLEKNPKNSFKELAKHFLKIE